MRCNLHTHTKHSDGALTPEELVEAAVHSGITHLAVTDHFETAKLSDESTVAAEDLAAYARKLQALARANAARITLYVGIEIDFGKRRVVRDLHNELQLVLRERSGDGRTFGVTFRAMNDGVAFRYELLSQPGLRDFVLDVEPELAETIAFHALGYYKPHRPYGVIGGNVCMIGLRKDHVRLGFIHGASLPDPEGLLEGAAKAARHIEVRSRTDIRRGAFKKLIRAAIAYEPTAE